MISSPQEYSGAKICHSHSSLHFIHTCTLQILNPIEDLTFLIPISYFMVPLNRFFIYHVVVSCYLFLVETLLVLLVIQADKQDIQSHMTCFSFIFPEPTASEILNSSRSYEPYNLLNSLYNVFGIHVPQNSLTNHNIIL